jgi:ribosomal protein S18 acetylase RimI-like enzyme
MTGPADDHAPSASPPLGFRPITPDDMEFLYTVYASTRAEELAVVDWTPEQKAAFLRDQFNAQHRAYQQTYEGSDFLVILIRDRPIGRLYVARWDKEIRIIDIALLPAHRNGGIGSAILNDLLAEGTREAKRITIHVEMFNPALRLYERLGFRKLGEHGVYHFMSWSAGSPA